MQLFNLKDINECSIGTSGCGQYCTNTNGSYECSCSIGYTIDTNGHACNGNVCIVYKYNKDKPYIYTHCADINECLNNHGGCDQVCHNTVGSYDCYCDFGYALNSNLHSCDGKNMHSYIIIYMHNYNVIVSP